MSTFEEKYLKYKTKYYLLKHQISLPQNKQRQNLYAIYAVPNIKSADPFLNQPSKWGGLHITVVGYEKKSNQYPKNIKQQIAHVLWKTQRKDKKPWKIDTDTIEINNKTINFKSKTLNEIAKEFNKVGFSNIKGPNFAGIDWHITSEIPVPADIEKRLADVEWSLVLIQKNIRTLKIEWLERFPIFVAK